MNFNFRKTVLLMGACAMVGLAYFERNGYRLGR